MKKSLIALAVLAASGAAMAQSSVTLYGVADAGVTFVDGASNWTGLTSGQLISRIGFRGTEDLGGGLKANFVLEAGVNLDNGDGNSGYSARGDGSSFAFKRRSTIGLAGGFGEVRLGRELTAAHSAVFRNDVFGSVGLGASGLWGNGGNGDAAGAVNNAARTTDLRVSNAVTYVSPNFAGFKVAANYGFGEVAGQNSQRRYMGLGATYDNGPLSLGLGGEQLSRDDSATAAGDITTWSLGGSYDLGVAKLLAAYRQSTVDRFAFATNGADAKRKGYMLAVTAPVGPGLVRAAYNRYQDSQTGLADAKADHFAVGYIYSLSKRTSVYGTYAYIKNKNNGNRFSLSSATAVDSGGKQQGLQVGITHTF